MNTREFLTNKRKKLELEEYLVSRFSDYRRDGFKVVMIDIKTMVGDRNKTALLITYESSNIFSTRHVLIDHNLELTNDDYNTLDYTNFTEKSVLECFIRDFKIRNQ
jgi:hypothetical protein